MVPWPPKKRAGRSCTRAGPVAPEEQRKHELEKYSDLAQQPAHAGATSEARVTLFRVAGLVQRLVRSSFPRAAETHCLSSLCRCSSSKAGGYLRASPCTLTSISGYQSASSEASALRTVPTKVNKDPRCERMDTHIEGSPFSFANIRAVRTPMLGSVDTR